MSNNNPETCICKHCQAWRETIKSICDGLNLDYVKLSRNHKTDLYNLYIHTEQKHRDNNLSLMMPKLSYALKEGRT